MTLEESRKTGREEDYRDYEERDVDSGWPYADGRSGKQTRVANRPYGETPENFDESGNPGFESAPDTITGTTHGIDLFGMETEADVSDDAIEERIATAIDESDIDAGAVEIRVRRGMATLEGSVETAEESRGIEAFVYDVPGIVRVHNNLSLLSVDGNMPDDSDA